ncbi:MAG TPA: lysophospholipid acyltransferase family protein [Verrucomicrobiae bacterium]|nr:lysophospholipid acyltransferase family protein [Verrucomicrobiae bacterium]
MSNNNTAANPSPALQHSSTPILDSALGWLLRLLVTAIGSTLRWRIDDAAQLLTNTPQRACIFAFWHNRIFLMPYLFRKHWHSRQRDRVAVLVSASKDGEKLTSVLSKFHLICVRGSSSRRGKEALRELTRLVEDGYDAGITPDGPRGPKYHCQDGVISLSQITQAPIIPVSYDLRHKVTINSWDNFMIPLPFTRATLHIGAPLTVAVDAGDAQREQKRLELEGVLKSLSQ